MKHKKQGILLFFMILMFVSLIIKNLAIASESENVIDLSRITDNITISEDAILIGKPKAYRNIIIASGVTVTFRNVTIERNNYTLAGITCEGNASIVLEADTENTINGGPECPGIYVNDSYTLTVSGSGLLIVNGGNEGAGIGSGKNANYQNAGNIIINSGNITAQGGIGAAGIGSGGDISLCRDIEINNGTVHSTGGQGGAGIGAGAGNCGKIDIKGGSITAIGGDYGAGIGSGGCNWRISDAKVSICETITISGGSVAATGGISAAGIGTGCKVNQNNSYKTSCGNIKISGENISITATPGDKDAYGLGFGKNGDKEFAITIGLDTPKCPPIDNLNKGDTYIYSSTPTHQYTVTFKVVNGYWDDETTADKSVTLEGYEGDTLKLSEGQIPTVGNQPDETYKAGDWDTVPSTDTVITSDTTYTYNYARKASISHTVTFKVVNGSWNEGVGDAAMADQSVTLTGYEGDTLKLAESEIPAVGNKPDDTYKTGNWDTVPSTVIAITKDTTYTYTYAKKASISHTVTFKVVNGSWNEGVEDAAMADRFVTVTGYEGDTLKLTEEQIPAVGTRPNDTYKSGGWDPLPSTDTAITTDTIYTYTYAKKASISYTVTFKVVNGSWNEGEGESATADKSITLSGYEGDALKLSGEQIPGVGGKPFANYKAGRWGDTGPVAGSVITENVSYTYTYAAKSIPEITAPTAKSLTYNGNSQILVNEGITDGGTLQYAVTNTMETPEENQYATTVPSGKDAGDYYVWYRVAGNENYISVTEDYVKVTISKADNPAKITQTATVVCGGNSIDLADSIKNAVGTVRYQIVGEANGCAISGSKFTSGTVSGTCKVKVSVSGDNDYKETDGEITVTVTDKNEGTLAVSQSGTTFGNALPDPVYQKPDMEGTEIRSYSGTMRDRSSFGPTASAPVNAGTYMMTVVYETADTIYSGISESFTIAPADINRADVTFEDSLTYNGSEQIQKISAIKLNGADITSECTVSGNKGMNAGTYTMTVTAKDTGNYTGSINKEFTIARRIIEPTIVISGEYFYTGKAIQPSFSVKDGDTQLSDSDYIVSITENINAGSGKITVSEKTDGNYSFSQKETTFAIKKVAVTVKALDQTVLLNGSIVTGVFQAVLTGAISGHELTAVTLEATETEAVTASGTITPKDAAISYNGTDVTRNYDITYQTGILTVTDNPDQTAADTVIRKISAIGIISYNDSCLMKIEEARAAYDALTAAQKALVTNAALLEQAENTFLNLQNQIGLYRIIYAEGCEHNTESDVDAVIRIQRGVKDDQTMTKFNKILIGGNKVDSRNYTTSPGSVIITLRAAYLNTLVPGSYPVTVVFTDGEVLTQLNIRAAQNMETAMPAVTDVPTPAVTETHAPTPDPTENPIPKTGDAAHPGIWFLMIVAGLGFISTVSVFRCGRKR